MITLLSGKIFGHCSLGFKTFLGGSAGLCVVILLLQDTSQFACSLYFLVGVVEEGIFVLFFIFGVIDRPQDAGPQLESSSELVFRY